MKMTGISIVIATWNGKPLLEKNLPSLFKALENYKGPSEVIVVDDAGTDETDRFISKAYPQILFKKLPSNIGNGQTLNRGAEMAHQDILYFLDNDVEVTEDFLVPLMDHFEDPDLFSAGSRYILSPRHTGSFEVPRVNFRFGIFWYYYEALPPDSEKSVLALFASAGHSAFRRSMFEALGGFDDLYGRFYLEDLDLCYRAWKRGWTSLIDPRSRVIHETAGTIRKILSEREIQRRQWRNRFLFTWKNIHTPSLILEHLFLTPFASLVLPFMGKSVFTLGFLDALGYWDQAWQKRQQARREGLLSDREVLKRVGPYREGENKNAY